MTRRSTLLLPSLSMALLCACGGNVTVDGTGTTTGTGTSSGSSGTSTETSSGTTGTSTGSTGTSTGSTGTSSTGACATPSSIDIVVDNDAPAHWTSDCSDGGWNPWGVTTPIGFIVSGGPAPGSESLQIIGCAGPQPASEGITISLDHASSPGGYVNGVVRYVDNTGSPWGHPGEPLSVEISKLGMVGDTIEGVFKAQVLHVMSGNAAHFISGSFQVCHTPDQVVP